MSYDIIRLETCIEKYRDYFKVKVDEKLSQRKLVSVLLAILLCAVCSLAAFAEPSGEVWTGDDFTVALPEEIVYTFSLSVPADDPAWVTAGIGDPAAILEEYQEMGVLADFYTEGRKENVRMLSNENSSAQNMYDLKELTEEQRQSFLDGIQTQNDDVTLEKEFVDINGQPFYRIQFDGATTVGEIHELQYGTIFNGHTLTFLVDSETPLTAEQSALVEKFAGTVEITKLLPKPEPDPVNLGLMLTILGVMAVVVLAPVIYLPLRKRRDKKQKAQMAELLSRYRKTHTDENSYGALKFVNETDCTREAVRDFSRYHAYGKNLVSLLLGAALCAMVLLSVFLFDTTWWLKAVGFGITVYYLYRAVSMPRTIEKVQQKVFGRGTSSTARYMFFEDGFRVTGIQSASVFPYFQITSVKRHGHYLYLYYGYDNAYLVDEYGFSMGSFEEFTAFISEKTKK